MHHNYDVVLCGAPCWVPAFAEAFGVEPGAVQPLGLPRVDYLAASNQGREGDALPSQIKQLRTRFPRLQDESRPVVLYAPTYRKDAPTAFDRVIEAFADDTATLVIKPHDLESASLAADHVVDATGVDVLDLISISDVIVTDYSAVAFEAWAANKPVLFYVSDIDEYSTTQGLNLNPLSELSDLATKDIEQIAERVRFRDFGSSAHSLCEQYGPAVDGACTRRIAEMLLERIAERRP
jgi:CDP-ribitol ribitolphosphotransferase